jgi:hypothetical protein
MPWKGKLFGWGKPKPFLGFLPLAGDATAVALSQLKEPILENRAGNSMTLSLEQLEAPSVDVAIRLMLEQCNRKLKFMRRFAKVPQPDPRKTKANFRLWKYRLGRPYAAVSKPPGILVEMSADIASADWDYAKNWEMARLLSVSIRAEDVKALLSVMVHPPAVRSDSDPCVWLQRIQIAAAQLAVWAEMKNNVPVEESLVAKILQGPLDWSVDAAAIALVQRANEEPESVLSVVKLLKELLDRIPGEGYWSCRETAVRNAMLIENLDADDRAEFEFHLARL